jgi:hypothetical protein
LRRSPRLTQGCSAEEEEEKRWSLCICVMTCSAFSSLAQGRIYGLSRNLNCSMIVLHFLYCFLQYNMGPPLWSSGQSSCLQIQRSWVQFLALPEFLMSSGSGTGSTQPHVDNWGATWMEK